MIVYLGPEDLIIKDLKRLSDFKYEITGPEPSIEIKNLPNGIIQELYLTLETVMGDYISVWWANEDEEYSLSSCVSQEVKYCSKNELLFKLMNLNEIKRLKLDFKNISGDFEIQEIKLFYLPSVLEGVSPRMYNISKHILKYQLHCDRYLTPLCNPKNKSILIIGSGHGTEILWCIRNGAKEVVGVDIIEPNTDAIEIILEQMDIQSSCHYEILKMSVEEIEKIGRKFDIVLSNNVFEHLPDIKQALHACKQMIKPYEGRIVIFADPLYYSSVGAHLPRINRWEHLWDPEIKNKTNTYHWNQYLALNRVKLSDVIKSIEENDLVILKLDIVPDRNLKEIKRYLNQISSKESLTNLTLEGISVELMRIEV